MEAQVVLRKIARAALNFTHLNQISGRYRDTRADRGFIALRSDQAKHRSVIGGFGAIDQQYRRAVHIHRQNIHPAVIIYVADRRAAPGSAEQFAETGNLADILEGAVAFVAEQHQRLAIRRDARNEIGLRIDMTVGDEEIHPAVVVHIQKRGAPGDIRHTGRTQTGRERNVGESLFSLIPIESVRRGVEVSDVDAEAAAVVEIRGADTHGALRFAADVDGGARNQADVFKRAVAIIAIQIFWHDIVCDV